jgi:hypothetical protein
MDTPAQTVLHLHPTKALHIRALHTEIIRNPTEGNSQLFLNKSPAIIANERGEQQLAEHILKALSPDETAPKQKHVRACIVYTHDLKSSGTLFMGIKAQPVVGDEVLTWKSLILFHKIISQGHSSVFQYIFIPDVE